MQRLGRFTALLLASLGFSVSLHAETEPFQPQMQFEAAIRNRSTSPNFILLTVVDDRTGQTWTGCTLAPFLLGAIERERDQSQQPVSLEEAIQIALSNTSHVFRFSKQAALDNVSDVMNTSGKYRNACDIVKMEGCARMNDRSGTVTTCTNSPHP